MAHVDATVLHGPLEGAGYCSVCGLMRPSDGWKKPCNGPAELSLRDVAQPAGVEGVVELPPSMRGNINSIARHIAAPAEDQGADVSEVVERATCALTLLIQGRPTPADLAERAQRAVERLCAESDLHYLLCIADENEKRNLADIIAAEFGSKPE